MPNDLQKEKFVCDGDGEEMDVDQIAIRCGTGHSLCTECAQNYINLMISEPASYLLRCQTCKCNLNSQQVLKAASEEQRAKLELLIAEQVYVKASIKTEEFLVRCPFCSYFEIGDGPVRDIIFECRRESCKKKTCLFCIKDVTNCDVNEDANNHKICLELLLIKNEFDTIIEYSSGNPCPECGIIGRKDPSCNHITCSNCKTEWCYFCREKIDNLDMADRNNIFSHFDDWETNNKRCPMSLGQINTVDKEWPIDDEAAVDMYHRKLLMGQLNKFVKKIGLLQWEKFKRAYAPAGYCGVTDKEIMRAKGQMFTRKN